MWCVCKKVRKFLSEVLCDLDGKTVAFDGVLSSEQQKMVVLTGGLCRCVQQPIRIANDVNSANHRLQPLLPGRRQDHPPCAGCRENTLDLLCSAWTAFGKPNIKLARMEVDDHSDVLGLHLLD